MWSCYDWVVVVVFRLLTQYVVILWLGCRCCRPSVSTICGRIMIRLSLSDNENPIIIRPHIMFTDGQQQRQPNHNTTTYCVYWRKTTTTQSCRIMIGLSLSSVSEHNMWSCYDWVVVVVFRLLTQYWVVLWLGCRCCRPSVIIRPHIVFTNGRQQRQPNHNTTTYCVYWWKTTTTQSLMLSSVSKHNMWSCYDWVVVVVFRQ
jgi:hypothetical protein